MSAGFRPGLHIAGRADPVRVVVTLTGAGVIGQVAKPARRAWVNISLAYWLRSRNQIAINAYREQS